jgi:endonuclease/exonuclease/phosphatase (EEP) superfamily protein YafD
MFGAFSSLLIIIAYLAAITASLASIAGFFGKQWWVFDLFSHFRWQYLAGLLLSAATLLLFEQYWGALLSAVFAIVNLGLILPLYRKPTIRLAPSNPGHYRTFRLLLANVLQSNRRFHLVADAIADDQPDLIVLVEVNQEWMEALAPVLEGYYHSEEVREDNFGIAILSRFPIVESKIHHLEGIDIPALSAHVDLGGLRLILVGVHPPPPKTKEMSFQRNLHFCRLAELARQQDYPLIIAGDLNSSSWSPHFIELIKRSGLRDSRQGFGLQLSWPAGRPHLLTSIDHILVSPSIQVNDRRIGPPTGSDHYPVTLDFSV